MNADDELDNLLRNHLSSELDPMRGQAGRMFEREVTRPMQRRLRLNAWQGATAMVNRRVRQAMPMVGAMAAAAALGFFVPRWWTNHPVIGTSVADSNITVPDKLADYTRTMTVSHEDHGLVELPTGGAGRRIGRTQMESATYVDPQTNARTEYLFFPADQETVLPTARQ